MIDHEINELSNIDSHIQTIISLQRKADYLVKELASTMLEIEGFYSIKDKEDE